MEKSSKPMSAPSSANYKLPNWVWWLILPVWVYGVFMFVQVALSFLAVWLNDIGVPLSEMSQIIFITLISGLSYALATLIVVMVPLKLWGKRTTLKDLGVPDLPTWMDILLSAPAYVVYIIASAIVMLTITGLFPDLNLQQSQSLPISSSMLVHQWEYVLAFTVLVVFAPVAEELLYRGYLYGKLRKASGVIVSIVVTSLAFGAAHLWTGGDGPLQWAVAIDTMVVSVMMCVLREYTGAIWAGVLVHMIKNGIAFYLLFINSDIIDQLMAAVLPLL